MRDAEPTGVNDDRRRELRHRAEETVNAMGAGQEAHLPEEARVLLHELRVHQLELEMQNEELRRAQEELEAARTRYFDLFNLAPMGYLNLDEAGLIREANLRAAELLGMPKSALIGTPLSRFILAADQDAYYQCRQRLFASGQSQACELRLRRPDGAGCWIRLEAGETREEPGGKPDCRVTILDISERKRTEEEKARLLEQLLQARKMELVGRLAGGVAHDFNNMLGVIIINIDLALAQLDPASKLRQPLDEINTAAQRSANLTRQMLAFARKQPARPLVLDLNLALRNMIAILRRLVGEDIHLECAPGRDLWQVRIDPSQFDQILTNLVLNARDAIRGAGTITIETANAVLDGAFCAAHPGSSPGEQVRLTVRDSGVGMSREILGHIFEPFFTTKDVGQGTGMGLASVYGSVKQNEGFIDVESEPGRGTEFRIYFHRAAAAIEDPARRAAARPEGGTETVLLVDDEPALLNAGKQILAMLGYTVLAAGSPQEALRLAGETAGAIDLLITDVRMPGMNGRVLAERLKAGRPGMKCLFVSGYPSDMVGEQGSIDQATPFLQKPFTLTDLAHKIRETLGS